jgi:hypothetical protein
MVPSVGDGTMASRGHLGVDDLAVLGDRHLLSLALEFSQQSAGRIRCSFWHLLHEPTRARLDCSRRYGSDWVLEAVPH